MPELEDLIPSIWLRLSIKSSVRFRSISKSWCAYLSDPHFIYKNLTAANEHDLLLLPDLKRQHYYSIDSQETPRATRLQVSTPKVPISPPAESESEGEGECDVLSPPCDDMVCFHVLRHAHCVRSIGVWSLTTGETKMVPLLVIDEDAPYPCFQTLGFGFDEKREEYKIVQIVILDSGEFAGYVYSLNSSSSRSYCNNGWRKVGGEPKMLFDEGPYSRSYKDGTFYWGSRNLIVSFDMSSEIFNPISFPPSSFAMPSRWSFRSIKEICMLKEGSMFIITVYYQEEEGSWHGECEIWALLDVGVEQSLTKLSVVDCGCEHEVTDCGCEDEAVPFGFWRNELILLSIGGNGRVLVGDPFEREIRKIHIDEPYDISKCLAWTKKGKKNSFLNS